MASRRVGQPLTAEEREARNNAIFDHWLAGETETELTKKAKLNISQVCRILDSLRAAKRDALQISEPPPIYNVWNFAFSRLGSHPRHPNSHQKPNH